MQPRHAPGSQQRVMKEEQVTGTQHRGTSNSNSNNNGNNSNNTRKKQHRRDKKSKQHEQHEHEIALVADTAWHSPKAVGGE